LNRKLWGKSRIALLAVFVGISSIAGATNVIVPLRIPDNYAKPATLVAIGHERQLNLRCTGSGPQTVMLEAGSHADSMTWFKLQPILSSAFKVCAYDRAGYGFSSEGPPPRNLDADVSDLHELIRASGIKTPVVLVGHSLGSNIVRRYAERYAADVSGMVLIDPPEQDVAAFAPEWNKSDVELNVQRFALIRQCEASAEQGALMSLPALKACGVDSNPLASAKLNAVILAKKSKPAFWRTLLSELQDNVVVFSEPVSPKETHGSVPLIVLTAANTYAGAPVSVRKALEAARDKTQAQIVATSTRGERLLVDNTSHDIQLDQPEFVAKAITRVLQQTATPDK
jgi:pimeloyl-ACP methyl ester carboxylesterase